MKTKLNAADRKTVNELCSVLLGMNNRDDMNTSYLSTYGHLQKAICTFVFNQTSVDISDVPMGWNLGGHETYADDIQVAIDSKAI